MRASRLLIALVLCAAAAAAGPASAARGGGDDLPARGADELYWVPTLEQALGMAKETGRPIFLMGYSLVGDGSTYTKLGDAACTGVY